jgi:hypothetical protein
MSVKRALEYNFKVRLDEVFQNSNVNIFESTRLEERILPCIIINGGDATLAVEHPDAMTNFEITFDILVLTNIDDMTVNEHKDIVDKCLRKINERDSRKKSVIQHLHLYDTFFSNTIEEYAERKLATSITYKCVCNYSPYPET